MAANHQDVWIQTFTGRKFFPLEPRPEDVCIEDIAHSLALTCRFRGHTRHYYSVAQHSCLASCICGDAPAWALLHDAAEAYLADVPRPVKPSLTGFGAMELRVLRAIADRFGLAWPMPKVVSEVDVRLLMTERRDLLAPTTHQWDAVLEQVQPYQRRIMPWSADVAEQTFLELARKVVLAK